MAIKLVQGFQITSASPIDSRLTLTKQQMLNYNLNLMPEKYLAVCSDDGKLYIFDKTTTPNSETGYFKLYEEIINLPGAIEKAMQTESGKAAMEEAVSTTLPGAIQKSMQSETGKEAMTQSLAETMPDVMLKTLQDPELGESLVNNMFDNTQFSQGVDSKIQFQVDQAIQCIEAIDGMA